MLAEPLPCRSRAIAGEIDGRLLGIGGLAYMPDGTVAAYLHVKPEARNYPVSLHRAALMILAEIKKHKIPRVVALAEDGIEPAKRWLARLGFEPITIDGNEVWTWQQR